MSRFLRTNGPGYRQVLVGPPERHLPLGGAKVSSARRLVELVHLTDFQLADLTSPARLEFLQGPGVDPMFAPFVPAYRPQEFLQWHAVEALMRSIDDADVVVVTGDNTDSTQSNEIDEFVALMDGGVVDPGAATGRFEETVHRLGHPRYWDSSSTRGTDWYSTTLGFPGRPGALDAACEPFVALGTGTPWLACFGNHDCLVQGRSALTPALAELLSGSRKPIAPPATAIDGDPYAAYLTAPEVFSSGSSMTVDSRDRRLLTRGEYVRRIRASRLGSGFTAENETRGTAYYSFDGIDGVRLIALDTTNPYGDVDGCLDDAQLHWLRERLDETRPQGPDPRTVVLFSHHGSTTMTNVRTPAEVDGPDLHDAAAVIQVLREFSHVVAWLSGHTHKNSVWQPFVGGPWEISTSAVCEWPVQARRIELFEDADGAIVLRSTMIDSWCPPAPSDRWTVGDLAALHREVAANFPFAVAGAHAEGTAADRNVVIRIDRPVS